jgi:5-hydroxyisourate hydrolase-like protein (transthyretin family)
VIKEKIYWIENAISNAQNVVHVWIWAGAFQKRNILGDHFLEVVLDFHFIGAALLKAASLTVMITFSVAQFNLHYHCPLTLPPSYNMKTQPDTDHYFQKVIQECPTD